jgi:hypothetical protein
MAHYAVLDQNNVVVNVITGKNEGEDGIDWEQYYSRVQNATVKRTSYNTISGEHKNGGIPFRKNYACIGFVYDEQRDAFIPPKNQPSWILNEDTCRWVPPIPKPQDGYDYLWIEETQSWILDTNFL